MVSPIQIVLNPENFEEARETTGGGDRKDFFAHEDAGFRVHKATLNAQVQGIAETLARQAEGDVGYVKVVLRRAAWAKSHRPLNSLFRSNRIPLVGGGDLGVMIFEARPRTLLEVAGDINKAEDATRLRYDDRKGKEVPWPSPQRSEVGAIKQVELYGPSDRRDFAVDDAVRWLANPMTGSSYQVQLFELPPAKADWDLLDEGHQRLFRSFIDGLSSIGTGLTVERRMIEGRANPVITMRLEKSSQPAALRLAPPAQTERRKEAHPFDSNTDRHARLLHFLEHHPLVRKIDLPGIIVKSEETPKRSRPVSVSLPIRDTKRSYPRLGIIDGGVSDELSDWVIDRWDLLADEDKDHGHGTFIGGLAVAGGALNTSDVCPEPDGVEIMDLAVFPTEGTAAFSTYFPDGLPQFFDEVSSAVAEAKARHGIRVFNMSLNVLQPAQPNRYSVHAARLDEIAEANDAIIFLSAGNTAPQETRQEWPADDAQALAALAAARNDGLLIPAESVRNVSVAALNPPGLAHSIAHVPARYSRRGPGLRSGVKPDLAHFGGSGTAHPPMGHGLFSILPDGSLTDGCGTSYAAPLVAKTAAVLDSIIEGDVSRETLIGLLAHHAQLPHPLRTKAIKSVARDLVGFGVPPAAERMLETDDHQITLVIASRIRKGQQVSFRFNWPASLVDTEGKCRGHAKLTLVSTPPLNHKFGAEFVRVNIDAALQQQSPDGKWNGRLKPIYLPEKGDPYVYEAEQIAHGLKWAPIKMYEKSMPRGVGEGSSWRLFVEYLTRSGEDMPKDGVPFTAILTISDIDGTRPVFNDLRQTLNALGVKISDIRTAARITTRV